MWYRRCWMIPLFFASSSLCSAAILIPRLTETLLLPSRHHTDLNSKPYSDCARNIEMFSPCDITKPILLSSDSPSWHNPSPRRRLCFICSSIRHSASPSMVFVTDYCIVFKFVHLSCQTKHSTKTGLCISCSHMSGKHWSALYTFSVNIWWTNEWLDKVVGENLGLKYAPSSGETDVTGLGSKNPDSAPGSLFSSVEVWTAYKISAPRNCWVKIFF